MSGLVNYSAVLQDADGSNLRFVANEHKFQTWGAGQSATSALSGILASSNQTTVMTVRGANVGIGVTLPVATLQVVGSVGIGAAYAAIVPPANGCIVAGNVGIGTGIPVAKLQVAGSVGIGTTYTAFLPPADGCIVAGNVGIGTTNPVEKLHVNGNIRSTGYTSSPNNILQVILESTMAIGDFMTGITQPSYNELPLQIQITPYFTTSKIKVEFFSMMGRGNQGGSMLMVLQRSINGSAFTSITPNSNSPARYLHGWSLIDNTWGPINLTYYDTPNTTLNVTYKLIYTNYSGTASNTIVRTNMEYGWGLTEIKIGS